MRPFVPFAAFTVAFFSCQFAAAQTVPEGFSVIVVASELDEGASAFALLPGDRALIAHKHTGQLKLLANGVVQPDPLVTVPNLLTSSEQGFIGVAVDPDFPEANYVYLFHTRKDSVNRISRYTLTGDLYGTGSLEIDESSQKTILDIVDHYEYHNGGTIRFGSDKTLYISSGDDAKTYHAQDMSELRGKILRINRDGSIPDDNPRFPFSEEEVRGEIFAFGLRNPFRFSIDPQTDELFLGDVGSIINEELNLGSGGENFGWPLYEGTTIAHEKSRMKDTDLVDPIYEYPHGTRSAAVIALLSYRQRDYPNDASFPDEFDGTHFAADFYRGPVWNLRPNAEGEWERVDFATGFKHPVDAALGSDGAFYILEFGRSLKKIVYNGTSG